MLDIKDDLEDVIYPDLGELITYKSRAQGTSILNVKAVRIKNLQKEGNISYGIYYKRRLRFRLNFNDVSLIPVLGDTITDTTGEVWTVLEAGSPIVKSNWTCDCIKVGLITGLTDTVDWYSTQDTTNSYGDRVKDPLVGEQNIKCRIQFLDPTVNDFMDKRELKYNYVIYMEGDLNLQFGDYFLDTSGVKYKFVQWKSRQTIDSLYEVYCIVTP